MIDIHPRINKLKKRLKNQSHLIKGLVIVQSILGVFLGIFVEEAMNDRDTDYIIFVIIVSVCLLAISIIITYSSTNSDHIEFLDDIAFSINSRRNRLLNNMLITCKDELRKQISLTHKKDILTVNDLRNCLCEITTHFKKTCNQVIDSEFTIGLYLKNFYLPKENNVKPSLGKDLFFMFNDMKVKELSIENIEDEKIGGLPLFFKQGIEKSLKSDPYFITEYPNKNYKVIFSKINPICDDFNPNYEGVLFTIKPKDFQPHDELEKIYEMFCWILSIYVSQYNEAILVTNEQRLSFIEGHKKILGPKWNKSDLA